MKTTMTPQEPATRFERDSFGPIAVPAAHLWGAQTQRSIGNFDISAFAKLLRLWIRAATRSRPKPE